MDNKKNKHFGKKIIYALVIAMSGLVILSCIVATLGFLIVSRPLGNMAVSALQVVENAAITVQTYADRVDGRLASLEVKTLEISDATEKIGQNVTDKGLVLTLLSEEREGQLVDDVNSVRDTFDEIRVSVRNGVELYRSIDEMPLINLPSLDRDQLEKIQGSVEQTQAKSEALRSEIADFRSGVTDRVDKVESAVSGLTEEIQNARERVARVNARMADLEALSIRLQADVMTTLTAISVFLILLSIFVIWGQVELIKKYRANWRLLRQDVNPPLPTEELVLPVEKPVPPDENPVQPVETPIPPVQKQTKTTKRVAPAKPTKKKTTKKK